MTIDKCSKCGEPAHATETDEDGRCEACRPVVLLPYDVLQVSRDAGKTWLDFSTLRDEVEFELARQYVTGNGPASLVQPGDQFRVCRPMERYRVVLSRHVPGSGDDDPCRSCERPAAQCSCMIGGA